MRIVPDRVAFLRFNHNVNVVFDLQEKGRNKIYLRDKIFQTQNERASGETAFFNTIWEALKVFSRAEPRPTNNKWLIAITDGDDNCSTIEYNLLSQKLLSSKVNLLIVGIALQIQYQQVLKELCSVTPKGSFIQNVESYQLYQALDSINNHQFHQNIEDMHSYCVKESLEHQHE